MNSPADNPTPPPASARRIGPALVLVVALLLGLGSGLLNVRLQCGYPLREIDTMQRAGSARTLLETGRWSTRVLRSWELVGHEHTAENRPWPIQNWSLAYPLCLAAVFALWHNYDAGLLAWSLTMYLGCVALVWLLARRLWDDRAALGAVALFLGYGLLPLWSALGHIESTYALCLLAATLLLLPRQADSTIHAPRSTIHGLAAGLLLGAAYAIRPTALAWIPLLLLAGLGAAPAARRSARGAALAGLALMIAGNFWLTRQLSVPPLPATGPTISYTQMALRETTSISATDVTDVTPPGLSYGQLLHAWPILARKVVRGLVEGLGDPDILLPAGLLILAPLGMVLGLPDPRRRTLAGAVLAAWAVSVLVIYLTIFFGLSRYAAAWSPFAAVFGGAGLVWLYDRARASRVRAAPAVVAALALLIVGGAYVAATVPMTTLTRTPEAYLLARQVQPLFPPDAIVAGYCAYELSWYTRLRVIETKDISPDQMLKLDRRLIRLDGFVLERHQFTGDPPPTLGVFRRRQVFSVPYEILKGQPLAQTWVVYGR
jgi:hypothetical protein